MTWSNIGLITIVTSCALVFSSAWGASPTPPRLCEGSSDCSTTTKSAGDLIKWNPGHYVLLPGKDLNEGKIANFLTAIDELASDHEIKGVMLRAHWTWFEGPSKGDYSNGFALIDRILNKLESLPTPKRLMLNIDDKSFGGGIGVLPRYIIDRSWYVQRPSSEYWPGNVTIVAKVWEAEVMDAYIEMYQAYGRRYNTHPLFEMVSGPETSLGVPKSMGFTAESYVDQVKRFYREVKPFWPNTTLRVNNNFGPTRADTEAFNALAQERAGLAVGGPDPEIVANNTRPIWANRLFRGLDGGVNRLGTVPWVGEVQESALGQKSRYDMSPQEIWEYYNQTMRATHMVWIRNTYIGTHDQRWETGILPYIRAIGGEVNNFCPSSYAQRCAN